MMGVEGKAVLGNNLEGAQFYPGWIIDKDPALED